MRERAGMRLFSNRADGNLSPGHQTSPPTRGVCYAE
ncbi:hypothetical protein FOQG_01650 [Fusarium oxysporum f. sp. raphani 54005]|uniref:Uncharacterized protein n=6 Tax=Fusarium oxysporum TaxID=5507 RepID=W9I5F5_FUSOX|nr:hypothetical protein FOXG_18505 [Fusarium oxysporum f. sp. lycopersici 4287]EWY88490.1 hypothetical protein FOYG_09658 [Fusarium oxysporum NRRL 32931]EWZ40001.1 hypothetical protein FOZG_08889 [Fusarium oxysporum Fo47]EWZ87903.1 hypothetical protein FOWG_09570 [Fusarium oxysporum f. sp. lycopersici MN25]EXA40803.1 hypothetical protein FOVG_09496 [Fusarium oxysporum f. sp. pisi HDV247]EXK34304.1 hypothetical protein FOMG_11313 [Fusarium oxysporum f. sp. melonis 26406]EXK98926.1 hypothetical